MENQPIETQKNKHRTLFLVYELAQVEELETLFHKRPEEKSDSLVVALSLEIEDKLKERNIPFSSAGKYKNTPIDLLEVEDTMMKSFFSDSIWKAFDYRGIALQATFKFMFHVYFQRVRYYADLLISVIEANPDTKKIVTFVPSEVISKTFGGLAYREINVVIDCLKVIANVRGVSIQVMPLSRITTSVRSNLAPLLFSFKRTLFGILLGIWNFLITIFRSSQSPRMIISDHWRNLGSSISLLKNCECIFLDRTEILQIGWRELFNYRMRFVHSKNFLSSEIRRRANMAAKDFGEKWNNVRNETPIIFVRGQYNFNPLLLSAIDDIFGNLANTLYEIEGTYALYSRLKPDIILLRASVSGQIHFSILPLVARKSGIPALELQHGLEYLGQGSWSREHSAEYIAVYGPLVKRELTSLGYQSGKIREIGSPRFDVHKVDEDLNGRQKGFTVLCIAPDIRPFEIYDSYSAEDYFRSVARAAKSVKDIKVIIKLRAGPANENMLRAIISREFAGISHTIAQHESLSSLYPRVDAVISCFSTAILEALQYSLPVIIPALNPVDAQVVNFHFSDYRNAGALFITLTQEELNKNISVLATQPEISRGMKNKIQTFLANNFLFDGNSSRRYTDLIIELTKQGIFDKLK